ncbi:hypothetical protein Glove_18g68 [Diversispora epigaea]|uniref:Uncharacterized protein n=1 Tax=Diversispora epigaea TaxID=1348612 RepID=A0A397JMG8_9GLOM|nr:hypothetical protein Glove_18g68 [Diversispora epigaea]
MLEQNNDSFSLLFSPHSIYLMNENYNEINNFEDFENETFDQENNEIFDQEFEEEIIDHLKFTPCVIIDFIKGKIQQCNETEKLRQLHNLFGTWKIDRDTVKEVDGVLSKLGVCNSHFQFDNKYLHKQNKQLKDFKKGVIQWCRCISCDKYINFFSQGVGCSVHSWCLNKQNIQVPCIEQYTCKALKSYLPFCQQVFNDIEKLLCICCSCYENLGGHIYHRPGRGKKATTCITENSHDDDTTKGLEFFGNWLINIA